LAETAARNGIGARDRRTHIEATQKHRMSPDSVHLGRLDAGKRAECAEIGPKPLVSPGFRPLGAGLDELDPLGATARCA
jgi:hypothetical protein